MMKTQRLGIGCVRVSSDRQERSIDEQKESIRAAALRDGIKFLEDGLWCADEGVSGSILNRPGLKKLLTLCHTRTDITDVYFWKRNRLTRSIDPLDGMNIEREIEKCGKRIHFVQGIQRTGNKLVDFIASGLEYAEAGQYLVNISADTIRGLVPLTKAGFDAGRPTPYGFDRLVIDKRGQPLYRVRDFGGGVRHKILPSGEVQFYENGEKPAKDNSAHSTLILGDPVRVEVIRRIFNSYVHAEKGMRTIAEELNIEGISSPRGGAWSIGTIRSMLVNPVYYGANVWNVRNFSKYHVISDERPQELQGQDSRNVRYNDPENWIVADEDRGFPPIIPKGLFDMAKVKRMRRNTPFTRGKSIAVPYYLSGLAVCSCGNNLHSHTKTSGKKKGYRKYHYYTCGGYAMKGKTVCDRYLLPRDALEGPVLSALGKRIEELGRYERIKEKVMECLKAYANPNGATLASIQARLVPIKERTRNWEAAIDRGLNVDMAVEKLNQLAKEKEALERQMENLKEREDMEVDVESVSRELVKRLTEFREVLANGSVAEVKTILMAYIGRIEMFPDKKRARVGFFRLPTRALISGTAQESARISLVAGTGFEPATFGL